MPHTENCDSTATLFHGRGSLKKSEFVLIELYLGDCLEEMAGLPCDSVDSIVVDPPYGISFMAKKWDYNVPSVEVWEEALRVLKPGGHMLCACGTRTQHRMVVNIEDAGFEIRDIVSWVYGSGFPKNLNIGKAIDKAAGAKRKVVGHDSSRVRPNRKYASGAIGNIGGTSKKSDRTDNGATITAPATEAAQQWDGWGTALKPACEFFTLARKPLSEKTIVANVLKWGTGGINIEQCRVGAPFISSGGSNFDAWREGENREDRPTAHKVAASVTQTGRFPANLIHDGSEEVLAVFPETKSGKMMPTHSNSQRGVYGRDAKNGFVTQESYGDQGSAARFFYCAKASKSERNKELPAGAKNNHPTVKPLALMRYLCRLITPPGGTVLDPYMGSGSTGKAAVHEGFGFVGIEIDKSYFKVAQQRIEKAVARLEKLEKSEE